MTAQEGGSAGEVAMEVAKGVAERNSTEYRVVRAAKEGGVRGAVREIADTAWGKAVPGSLA